MVQCYVACCGGSMENDKYGREGCGDGQEGKSNGGVNGVVLYGVQWRGTERGSEGVSE